MTKKDAFLALTLPMAPSINHYYGQSRTGRRYIKQAGIEFRKIVADIVAAIGAPSFTGRVSLFVAIYPADRRRQDIDNRVKSLQDALTHAGVWLDDEQIDDLHLVRKEICKGGKVQIVITEINDQKRGNDMSKLVKATVTEVVFMENISSSDDVRALTLRYESEGAGMFFTLSAGMKGSEMYFHSPDDFKLLYETAATLRRQGDIAVSGEWLINNNGDAEKKPDVSLIIKNTDIESRALSILRDLVTYYSDDFGMEAQPILYTANKLLAETDGYEFPATVEKNRTIDDIRNVFEQKHILANGGNIDRTDGGEYRNAATDCAWDAWLSSFDTYSPLPKQPTSIKKQSDQKRGCNYE